ncbi:9188_t:CDS:10 [Diversispora eburnea]|uniref:MMS19 nucleotide excision repair protein n=1 Tax=Diversispora eburnea TaxID=1213867 RepID=A0A9N8VDA5_9GLOM|nr:9188_t:CDS:10 [Diversispora eburnea]
MERLVRSYMITSNDATDDSNSIVSSIVQNIWSGQLSLLALVTTLEEFLTSEESSIRAKGTGLLSAVLTECPQEQVNLAAVNVLVDFYCERLSDTTCVPELIRGLVSISQFNSFQEECAIKVSKSIFSNVNVQNYQQTTRHGVFLIFDVLLNTCKKLGTEFVKGFIQAMDGEKDPRNLLLAFSLVKLIIKEFDISEHVEELFEVTFCYFPITFRPPPDDPYGITSDDLKISLRECLSATAKFAKNAMPLFLEKLTSSSGNAKKDSMETLAACAPVYGTENIVPYIDDLWEYLKDEIFNAKDDSFEVIALDTIRSLVVTLSAGVIGKSDHLQRFLKTVVTECMENLKVPELKLSKPCGRILKYCAMASATRKKAILEILMEFIVAAQNLYGTIERNNDSLIELDFSIPLISFKNDLLRIFSSALMKTEEYNELRLCGLRGLHGMILLRQFLLDHEIEDILKYFNQIILIQDNDQDIIKETLKYLGDIAHYKPFTVLKITIPIFISQLPSNYESLKLDDIHGTKYSKVLDAISEVAIEKVIFEALVPEILAKLDVSSNLSIEYIEFLLHTLHTLFIKKSSLNHDDISKYSNILIPHLISKCVGPTLEIRSKNHDDKGEEYYGDVFCDLKIIQTIAGIISIITKNMNSREQTMFITQIFELFTQGNLQFIPFSEIEKNKHAIAFNPLMIESSSAQKNLTLLFTAAVGYMRQEVSCPIPNISDFLSRIVNASLLSNNEIHQNSLAQLTASILNKWNQENELENFIKIHMLDELVRYLSSPSSIGESESNRIASLNIFIWALVLRTHPAGYECINYIINLFNDDTLGKKASSDGFKIIIGDSDLLNKQSFAVIKVFPLLVHSLSLPDPDLKASTIDTFYLISLEMPHIISEHVSTLIPLLLSLTNVEVRMAALQCLSVFPDTVSFDVLYPFKSKIIRDLEKVLDDKKRIVRKEAVNCRKSSTIFEREQFLSANSFLPGIIEDEDEGEDDFIVISGGGDEKESSCGITGLEGIIEKIGYGKFQKRLLGLCGFGWLADNLWFQAISIILPRVQIHFQVSNSILGLLPSAIILGMMFGAIFWGVFSDTFGRKQAFNWTLILTAFFGLISSLSQNFWQLCLVMFLLGTGVGGNLPVDGAIFLEFVPKNQQYLLTFMSIFWSFGAIITLIIAYFILPSNSCPETSNPPCDVYTHNNGWRYLLAICGFLTLFMLICRILFFGLKESPKYLIARNRKNEAVDILREVARINGSEVTINVSDLTISNLDRRHDHPSSYNNFFSEPITFIKKNFRYFILELQPLFAPKWIRTTILVWSFWALNSFAYNMFSTFLPEFLEFQEMKNEFKSNLDISGSNFSTVSNISDINNISNFDNGNGDIDISNVIRQVIKEFIIFSVWGIPGTLIGTYLIETSLGRIYTMSLGAFGSALSVFLFTIFDSRIGTVTCNILFNVLVTIEYAVIYGYTAEVFETKIRGTANGFASACARITGMLGPVIAGNLIAISNTLPLYVSSIIFVLVGICMTLLPIETRGRQAL